VARFIDHVPILVSVCGRGVRDDSEDLEDGHDFLLVALDVLLQVEERVLDRALEGTLHVFVQLTHEVKPVALDDLLAVVEVLVVNVHELAADCLVRVLEEHLLGLKLLLLGFHEAFEGVEVLLDLGENGVGDLFKLVSDFAVAGLELVNFVESVLALIARLDHKLVSTRHPVVPLDTATNDSIKELQLIREEIGLSLVNKLHDIVVIPHNQHNILSQHSQLVFSLQELNQHEREVQAESADLLPVLHLELHLQKLNIEVRFEHSAASASLLISVFFYFSFAFFLLILLVARYKFGADENGLSHAVVNNLLSLMVAHGLLPVLEVGLGDGLVKLVLELVVAVHGFFVVLVLRDEVEAVDRELGLVDALDQRVHPDGDARVLRVGVGQGRGRLGLRPLVKQILNFFHLIKEEFVDQISSLLLNVILDGWSPCHLEEVLKHFNGILNGGHMLECKLDDGGVDNFNGLDIFFEFLSVVVVPESDFDIEDVVIELLDLVEVLQEHVLEVHQGGGPLGALGATEYGKGLVGAGLSELELALTDFLQVFAALDKGLVLSEDLVFTDGVALAAGVLLDHSLGASADIFPLLAAVDALVEVSNALVDVAAE